VTENRITMRRSLFVEQLPQRDGLTWSFYQLRQLQCVL